MRTGYPSRPASRHPAGTVALAITLAASGAFPVPLGAAIIDLHPESSFEAAVESLQPGDTLVVHAGTYLDSGRISITVRGTQAAPVVIRAAAGEARPLIARPAGAAAQNTINVEGATHLTIRGLDITSNGGDGINLNAEPSYVTIEDLLIHDISVGINFRSSMHHITVRGVEIHDTHDTGEGMYVGCNYAACAVSDSLFEGNYIHHTLGSEQGDGIEIKLGSYGNVVRDNVIHDTHYPCILVYGTEGHARNVIERNAMWNCGDSGIQAAADAVIRNNLIVPGAGAGFNSQDHQGASPANLEFVANTVVGGHPCLLLRNWAGKAGIVFANNAVFCPGADYSVTAVSGVQASGNVFAPAPPAFASATYVVGRSATLDLANPGALDLYPTADSALRGAANAALNPADDFNGSSRNATSDAGAYVYAGTANPGWAVAPGFKLLARSPPAPEPQPVPEPEPEPPPAPDVPPPPAPTPDPAPSFPVEPEPSAEPAPAPTAQPDAISDNATSSGGGSLGWTVLLLPAARIARRR